MARAQNPNSANSQFFICFNDCSFLDGQYSVWGQVVEGMEFVDNITRGEPPADPDKIDEIEKLSNVADVVIPKNLQEINDGINKNKQFYLFQWKAERQ